MAGGQGGGTSGAWVFNLRSMSILTGSFFVVGLACLGEDRMVVETRIVDMLRC